MRQTILSITMGVLALGSITTSTLVGPPVYAQEVEEVIVTARRREESLQDVPLSVTAFSGETIDRAGFANLEDISMQTTGFQVNSNLGGTRPGRLFGDLRFRGVEGSPYSSLATSSAFVDGVFALQGAQSLALVDLERVEIVKGPQSALFGRNSFAGAINYVTRDPNLEEFAGRVIADAGQRESLEFQASIEGPIIQDKLAFRVGGSSYNKGNHYTASDGGALGEQSSVSAFLALLFKPTDNLTLKFRAYHQVDDDGSEAVAFLQGRFNDTCTGTTSSGFNEAGEPVTLTPANFLCGDIPDPGGAGAPRVDSNTSFFPVLLAENTVGQPNLTIPNLAAGTLPGQFPVPGAPIADGFGLERRMTRFSLAGTYEFENGMVLNATLATNENGAASLRDWDMTTAEAWYVTNPQYGEDDSFDIRLESSPEGRLRWLVGASWYQQEFATSAGGGDLIHSCGIGAFFPGFPCNTAASFGQPLDAGDFIDVTGIYGAVSFDVTDRFVIDAELRVQSDERNDGRPNAFINTVDSELPRLSLTYKVTDDINVYATYSQSVIPGVINSNVLNCSDVDYDQNYPADPVTGQPNNASQCDQYLRQGFSRDDPVTPDQELNAYEIGLKSSWLEGRLLVNVAAYWQEWLNNPSARFVTVWEDADGDGIPNTNANFRSVSTAGSSEYWGVELESALAVTDNWNVNFNLTWNDNKFTEFFASTASARDTLCPQNAAQPVCGLPVGERVVNLRDRKSSRFPEWSWNLSSTYTGRANADWDWFVRGDLMYMGEAFAGQTNLATLQSYYLLNARIGIERDDLRVEVYAKNALDEETWRGGAEFTDFSLTPDPLFAFNQLGIILLPQDKRTFGVRVAVDF